MTAQYLALAVILALTLSHPNRFVRAGGTLLAAIGLAFSVLEIETPALLTADVIRMPHQEAG